MTDNTVVDAATAMSQAVQELAQKAGEAAASYGPQAMQIAVDYTHALAVLSSIQDILAIFALVGFWFTFVSLLRVTIRWSKDLDDSDAAIPAFIGFAIAGLIGGVCTPVFAIAAVQDFFSPATFFGLFEPKMAVLNYAISLVHN